MKNIQLDMVGSLTSRSYLAHPKLAVVDLPFGSAHLHPYGDYSQQTKYDGCSSLPSLRLHFEKKKKLLLLDVVLFLVCLPNELAALTSSWSQSTRSARWLDGGMLKYFRCTSAILYISILRSSGHGVLHMRRYKAISRQYFS